MKTHRKTVSFPAPVYSAYRKNFEKGRVQLGAHGISSFSSYCLFLMAMGNKALLADHQNTQLNNLAIKAAEDKR